MITRYEVPVQTNASGAATAYTPHVSGVVRTIRYTPTAATPLDANADVTVTAESSGLSIWSCTNIGAAAVTAHVRAALVSVANAALLHAAGGTPVTDSIPVANERIKVVVAQGDDTKTGHFHVYLET